MISIFVGVPLLFILIAGGLVVAFRLMPAAALMSLWRIPAVMVAMAVIWSVPFLVRHLRITAFDVNPLRDSVANALSREVQQVPTYATLGLREEGFDPDLPGFYHLVVEGCYLTQAMAEEQDIPIYERVDLMSPEKRTAILIASAALPFGVFPSVFLEGKEYIDGGLADNIPIVPMIGLERCDEIVVVRLRPHREGEIEAHWKKVDRTLRVREVPDAERRRMYFSAVERSRVSSLVDEQFNPPINFPYRDFPSSVRRVHVIAPSRLLGNFLTGTMNFRASYAAELMQLGYRDALEFLQRAIS